MSSLTDAQLSRLTRDVRNHISKLEADLAYCEAKLAEGPEDSNTFAGSAPKDADAYGLVSRPLGRDERIIFVLPDGTELSAHIQHGALDLRTKRQVHRRGALQLELAHRAGT